MRGVRGDGAAWRDSSRRRPRDRIGLDASRALADTPLVSVGGEARADVFQRNRFQIVGSGARISLCVIVRDCGGPLVRCLRSLLECDGGPAVDELCVVDTGSQDDTLDALAAYHRYVSRTFAAPVPLRVEQVTPASEPTWYAPGGGLCSLCHGHGRDKGPDTPPCSRCGGSGIYPTDGPPLLTRYGEARTRSFAMATQPWVLWADSDDVCEGWGGLQGALATLAPEVSGVVAPYWYDFASDGRVLSVVPRTRIVRRDAGYRWQGRYHEDLLAPPGSTVAAVDDLIVQHRRRGEPNKGRLHAVLRQIECEEGGLDSRLSGYMVQHHLGQDRPRDALPYAERALSLAQTAKEGLDGTLALASVHLALGDHDSALAGFEQANAIDGTDIDAALGAFLCCARLRRTADALAWWAEAERRPGPPRTISTDEIRAMGRMAEALERGPAPHGLPSLSPAALALGRGVPVTSDTPLRATVSAPRCPRPGCGQWIGHAGRCGPVRKT